MSRPELDEWDYAQKASQPPRHVCDPRYIESAFDCEACFLGLPDDLPSTKPELHEQGLTPLSTTATMYPMSHKR